MTRSNRSLWVLVLAAIVLGGGALLQWMPVRDVKEGDRSAPVRQIRLAGQVPQGIAGWSVRDEPLGSNESLRSAVERTLNYDDYVYRVYSRGNESFGVYVAYWSPGRLPVQKVASHTPDRCWTENGWTCPEQRFAVTLPSGNEMLMPGQWRRFLPPNGAAEQFVLYWHLVGGQPYDYGERFNARPDLVKWWRDTVAYAFRGSDEQYFIRLTSDRPFEQLVGDPGFQEVLSAVGKLGLAARM